MDKEQVINWFGNRGYPINPSSKIKFKCVNKDWLFINDPKGECPDEVELYYTNSQFCEPEDSWSAKGFNWSKEELNKLINDKPENQFGYCLYAHSGDCTHDTIILNGNHLDVIEEYLKVENEREIQSAFHWKSIDDLKSDKARSLHDKSNDLGNKLIDLGIFHHKWHKRSSWILTEVEFDEDNKPSLSGQYTKPQFLYQKEES
jgi:hypothetical protein